MRLSPSGAGPQADDEDDLLLGLGYALHFPFFSLNKLLHDTRPEEYAMMFQVDILHCLAVSILMLQVFIVIARTPRRFLRVTAGAGAVIVLVSPLVWLLTSAACFRRSSRRISTRSYLPFSHLSVCGVSLCRRGHWAPVHPGPVRRERSRFFRRVARVADLAAVTGFVCDLLPLCSIPRP